MFPVLCLGSNSGEFDLAPLERKFREQEKVADRFIKENPNLVRGWSSRGDMRLFLGNFEGAKLDYEKMIELNPELEVSHWRLGIAYFYLEEYDKAARQFQIYHNYDAVDRENGIWRFMSQFKSNGLNAAREGLLKYEKDDRPPYPLLYEMFAGRLSPDEVFSNIETANYSKDYRERVLFHATLYAGIYLELVEKNQETAKNMLKKAFENIYGQSTGTYMWQKPPTMMQSLKFSGRILVMTIVLNFLASPLLILGWFIPPIGLSLQIVLNGYLLGKEYGQLVEFRIPKNQSESNVPKYFANGMIASCIWIVPILNLLAPILLAGSVLHTRLSLKKS